MIFVMQCLNEEFYVDRCIADFHDEEFVDKIIVIDGGSTDYTVQELKKYDKVQTFVHPWLDWYHDMNIMQRNIGMSYVPKGSYYFFLDFDEVMNEDLKQYLREFDEELSTPDLINIPRKTFELMRFPQSPFAMYGAHIEGQPYYPIISHQIGQFPDYQPRLIRRRVGMCWANSPHHVLCGWQTQAFLSEDMHIIHYEKDDERERLRIERKWIREQARRKELGLEADVFETKAKPEVAEYADPEAWK